jgi:hypothetical protein
VPLHDALAQRQPDTGAFIFLPRVQPLEDLEDAVGLPRVDAVILNRGELLVIMFLIRVAARFGAGDSTVVRYRHRQPDKKVFQANDVHTAQNHLGVMLSVENYIKIGFLRTMEEESGQLANWNYSYPPLETSGRYTLFTYSAGI